MKMTMRLAAIAGLLLLGAAPASAQGVLTVYCGGEEQWCRAMATTFEASTGIKVLITRKSSGETFAQIKAEANNPRADVWWGGTGDPHVQAGNEGLTESYRSPRLAELQDWAVRQADQTGYKTVGVYAGALGFSYNTELLAKKGLAAPTCWADLLAPAYANEVQVADPNSSGTSYTMIATFVQSMGEDKAFDFLKRLHRNVNQYTVSGTAPARAVATGETMVGITFMDEAITQASQGAPMKIVAPCEGTGYAIGSMSLIKGGKNPENARKWYDWALSAEAQGIANGIGQFQVPSNRNAPVAAAAPKLADIKLIDYDFVKYGASDERRRLLSKWTTEVKSLPK